MTWLGSTGDGSHFAPTEHASFFFDRLAAMSVVLRSGIVRIPTIAKQLEVPRIVSDANVAWTDEGTEITPSDPGSDTVTAIPRALKALVYASNELIADSNPQAQNVLATNLARATALKLDLGFLEGSGTSPEITGLKNQSGIQAIDHGTAALTDLDPFADALGLLGEADAIGMDDDQEGDLSGYAIVMHPRNWRALTKIKETDTSNKPVIVEGAGSPTSGVQRSIYGVRVWLTSQLSTDEGTGTDENSIYVYDKTQVVAVIRQDATVETDRSAAFSSDRTAVRVVMRADLVLPNPAAVVRISGVTA
jgi:HK97 family phage major capsid protein